MSNLNLGPNKVWKMSLGKKKEQAIFNHCINHNEIRLGHGYRLNFAGCSNKGEIKAEATKYCFDLPPKKLAMIDCFINIMKIGDLVFVFAPNDYFKAIGIVTSFYFSNEFPKDWPGDFMQVRKVQWLRVNVESPIPFSQIYDGNILKDSLHELAYNDLNYEALAKLLINQWQANP